MTSTDLTAPSLPAARTVAAKASTLARSQQHWPRCRVEHSHRHNELSRAPIMRRRPRRARAPARMRTPGCASARRERVSEAAPSRLPRPRMSAESPRRSRRNLAHHAKTAAACFAIARKSAHRDRRAADAAPAPSIATRNMVGAQDNQRSNQRPTQRRAPATTNNRAPKAQLGRQETVCSFGVDLGGAERPDCTPSLSLEVGMACPQWGPGRGSVASATRETARARRVPARTPDSCERRHSDQR